MDVLVQEIRALKQLMNIYSCDLMDNLMILHDFLRIPCHRQQRIYEGIAESPAPKAHEKSVCLMSAIQNLEKMWKNWKLIIIVNNFVIFEVPWLAVLEHFGMAILAELLAALVIRYNKKSISKLWEAEELQLLTYLLFLCNNFKLHLESKLKNSLTMLYFFKGYIWNVILGVILWDWIFRLYIFNLFQHVKNCNCMFDVLRSIHQLTCFILTNSDQWAKVVSEKTTKSSEMMFRNNPKQLFTLAPFVLPVVYAQKQVEITSEMYFLSTC